MGRLAQAQTLDPVLKTEGRVTLVDAYVAGAVLVGLVLNASLGWWWADPPAGPVIVFYRLREGWDVLHHETSQRTV
jgi:divalent metal cation (Fe/Co/Zn/Cd) transporter